MNAPTTNPLPERTAMTDMSRTLASLGPWSAHNTGAAPAPAGKTQRMLDYIRENRSANAIELAIEADLDNTGLVGALLKNAIKKGQVDRIAGRYHWNAAYDAELQADLLQAAQVLRRHGWKVQAPR